MAPRHVLELDEEDGLRAAEGIILGCVLGLALFWIPLLAVAVWWVLS